MTHPTRTTHSPLELARTTATLLGAAALLSVHSAHAGSPRDAAAAQGLFDEARTLMKSGQYAPACPKLAESERLDRSNSTEFHLADCYEHIGRTASAWALFLQVASEAKAKGSADGEKLARARAAALAPRVPRVTVVVPSGSEVDGLEVKRDDDVVGRGQWGSAVPIDPGKHTLSATAPGRAPWTSQIDVAEGKTVSIDIPALVAAPIEPVVAPPPDAAPATVVVTSAPPAPKDESPGHSRRTLGLVIGGAGILAAGIGAFFGIEALSKNSDSNAGGNCTGNLCNPSGYSLRHDAITDGTLSTVLVGVGAAAIIGGGILWFTAPRSGASSESAARLELKVGPSGFIVKGAF